MSAKAPVKVIGAGLAGCEAAWRLALDGYEVELVDMKPEGFTPAHSNPDFCELVCSNSLKSSDTYGNACGLLKEEMRRLGSLTMEAAERTRVPAGAALAVDRDAFACYVTKAIRSRPEIRVTCEEAGAVPDGPCVVATGPLTQGAMAGDIERRTGRSLHFFDASAPIVSYESLDRDRCFVGDRYGRGTGDYINCPLTRDEYYAFVDELTHAGRATAHEFEKGEIFEGCMPVEVMASRGADTLRFGPLKPTGLFAPDGRRPFAVLQLRRESVSGDMYGLVGFQTNLLFPEQRRVFSMIPALSHAEFLRYGVMHRNSYLPSPECLERDLSLKSDPDVFFAGQMTGVEGYVESAATGIAAAIGCERRLEGKDPLVPDGRTVLGALMRYVTTPTKDFQPMNANFGILEPLGENIKDKKERCRALALRALESVEAYKRSLEDT